MSIHKKLIEFHKKFNGAKKTGVNPHFKSEHFTLDDVVHATTATLNEIGLYVTHYVDGDALVTAIYDESGESLTSKFPMQLNSNPQAMGSLVTYYKRYNLCALLNIAEADDDGNAAAAAAPKLITDEQYALINEYANSDGIRERLSPAQVKFLDNPDNWKRMTELQAKNAISKLQAA
jgi:hypothetical protein